MKKSLLFSLIISFAIILSGCGEKKTVEPAAEDSPIIFFYGEECPHCKNVEKFVEENNVREKVNFSEREVYHNEANSALFVLRAKECGYSEDNLGVPLLWNEGKCLVGDEPIIEFFKEKLK